MGRQRQKKHKKGFPQCCGKPCKIEQGTGKASREIRISCDVCKEVTHY